MRAGRKTRPPGGMHRVRTRIVHRGQARKGYQCQLAGAGRRTAWRARYPVRPGRTPYPPHHQLAHTSQPEAPGRGAAAPTESAKPEQARPQGATTVTSADLKVGHLEYIMTTRHGTHGRVCVSSGRAGPWRPSAWVAANASAVRARAARPPSHKHGPQPARLRTPVLLVQLPLWL